MYDLSEVRYAEINLNPNTHNLSEVRYVQLILYMNSGRVLGVLLKVSPGPIFTLHSKYKINPPKPSKFNSFLCHTNLRIQTNLMVRQSDVSAYGSQDMIL